MCPLEVGLLNSGHTGVFGLDPAKTSEQYIIVVNLGCVDQSFTITERDMSTDLSNVAQVVESRLTYAVYLFVPRHDIVEPRTDVLC